jgi:hypothetical protein
MSVNTDNLESVSTDQLPELLANSEKLIGKDPNELWLRKDHLDSYANMSETSDDNNNNKYDYDNNIESDSDSDSDDSGHKRSEHNDHNRNSESDYARFDSHNFGRERDTFYSESYRNKSNDDWYEKIDLLRQLGELKKNGVTISKNYGLDDDADMMRKEIQLHKNIRSKHNAVSWMGGVLVLSVRGLEALNDNINPFDVKLDGLHEEISGDINNYYEVLGEIYERYTTAGKPMNPWLKLLMMMAGATMTSQLGKIKSEELIDESKKLEKDEDFIRKMKEAKKADVYRKKMEEQAKQQMDVEIKNREQFEQAKRAQYAAKKASRNNDFQLSSEANHSANVEIARKEREERKKRAMDNLRNKARINSQRERASSSFGQRGVEEYNKFARKNNTLNNIMADIDDSSSVQSSASSVSVNRNIKDIMSGKTKKKTKKDNASSVSTLSTISSGKFNGVISFGSKNKGVKHSITVGSK